MKHRLILAVAAFLAVPSVAESQLGLAARAGTLGVGGEAAIGVSERLVLRGGLGFSTLNPSTTFDDVEVDLTLPERWYNVGLDVYLNGATRIGAGVLLRSDDPSIIGRLGAPTDIGGQTFTPDEIGTLSGTIRSNQRAAYALIGFGKHTDSGFGLSLDLGAAYMGDPEVTLESEGGTYPNPSELEARLAQEAQNFEDDMKTYLRFWPILNVAVRVGFGG